MHKIFFNLFFLVSLITITSCASYSYEPNVVSKYDVQKQQLVRFGEIIDINAVIIEGNREVGSIAGAAIGGAIGKNATDSDPESDIAGILGGLIGSAIGSEISSSVSEKDGIELLIKTDSGKYLSVIQEKSNIDFKKGQYVQIITRNGKTRVLPAS
jgi:outer membrane lipoprotein SlyB